MNDCAGLPHPRRGPPPRFRISTYRKTSGGWPQRRDFVAIADAVRALPASRIVLDGEAVAHCPEGLPDFHALLGREGCARACFYAFDLLHADADDLRGLTLVERRALLREHLKRAGAAIIFSEHMTGADGEGRRGARGAGAAASEPVP